MALNRFGLLFAILLTCLSVTSAYADSLENALVKAAPGADAKVIALAVRATQCSRAQGVAPAQRLAVIDYSLPSTEQRLWVFDLKRRKLLFHELVAHGRTEEELEKLLGADKLIFQDLADLIDAVKHKHANIDRFDCSVFTGEYVTQDIDAKYLSQLELFRNDAAKEGRKAGASGSLDLPTQ